MAEKKAEIEEVGTVGAVVAGGDTAAVELVFISLVGEDVGVEIVVKA